MLLANFKFRVLAMEQAKNLTLGGEKGGLRREEEREKDIEDVEKR